MCAERKVTVGSKLQAENIIGINLQNVKFNNEYMNRFSTKKVFSANLMIIALMFAFSLNSCDGNSPEKAMTKEGDRVIENVVKDIDGNTYDAVKLGNQVWMKSNLQTTSNLTEYNPDDYFKPTNKFRYDYDSVKRNSTLCYKVDDFGRIFYDKNTASSENICPEGWHVPSISEWEELEHYMMSQKKYICGISNTHIAKALADSVEWKYYLNPRPEDSINIGYNPLTTNNASGFSAQGCGFYYYSWKKDGEATRFWTSTESKHDFSVYQYYIEMNIDKPYITKDEVSKTHFENDAFYSIRCIKDN